MLRVVQGRSLGCSSILPQPITAGTSLFYGFTGESSDLCFRDVELQLVASVLISLVGGRNLRRVHSS